MKCPTGIQTKRRGDPGALGEVWSLTDTRSLGPQLREKRASEYMQDGAGDRASLLTRIVPMAAYAMMHTHTLVLLLRSWSLGTSGCSEGSGVVVDAKVKNASISYQMLESRLFQ
jgi:hypothetical protein